MPSHPERVRRNYQEEEIEPIELEEEVTVANLIALVAEHHGSIKRSYLQSWGAWGQESGMDLFIEKDQENA